MKEQLKQPQMGVLKGIAVVLGIVATMVLAVFINFLIHYLLGATYSVYGTYIIFGAVMLAVIFIVKYRIQEYIYLWKNDVFAVAVTKGSRERLLLEVEKKDITGLYTWEEAMARFGAVATQKMTFMKKEKSCVLAYGQEGKQLFASVSLTDAFRQKMQEDLQKDEYQDQADDQQAAGDSPAFEE